MSGLNRDLIGKLRSRIREFEDRKITGADLSREVFFVAREVHDADEAALRRALEIMGNKMAVLVERGTANQTHREILEVVDDIESELVEWGY